MFNTFLKTIADRLGFEVRRKPAVPYEYQRQAAAAIAVVAPYTMLPWERLVTLYQKVAFCEQASVVGDLVECGVWKGGAVALMALANLVEGRQRRHIHLFDSFQEICAPDSAVDGAQAVREAQRHGSDCNGQLRPVTGIYDSVGGPGTLAGNRRLLEEIVGYDSRFLHYHAGWFQETMPRETAQIGPVAILRLDGDWYASTKICLEHLYDKVVSGGFVIIDDYGAYEGCRRAVDEFLADRGIKAFLHSDDRVCRYWIKP
jgi:hypothetical protein